MKIYTFILGALQTNCYFLVDEQTKKTAIIDPADQCERILQKLKDKELEPILILLTHGHFDHMLALNELRQATACPVALHKSDAEALTDTNANGIRQFFSSRSFIGCKADKILEDGDQLSVGNETVRVLHTPGHTAGSVCYLAGDALLSGDTVFAGSVGRTDLYGGSQAQLLKSLKKLKKLYFEEGDKKLYPGHGNLSRLSAEIEANPFFAGL